VLTRRYRRRFAGAREPGLAVPGDTDRYPTNDERSDSSENCADQFDAAVPLGNGFRRLERRAEAFAS
jgi:hypothetical protein